MGGWIFPLIFSPTIIFRHFEVDSYSQGHRGHRGERDCKTYLTMMQADSQKEDITISRTAKWELSPQTYKWSWDSSWGLTSAWEIKYPGSRCSYNQWCYFLYFKLPLAVGAMYLKIRCVICLICPELKCARHHLNLWQINIHRSETDCGDCWRAVFVQHLENAIVRSCGSDWMLPLHTKYVQLIYQLINKSNLPEACGCGISTDRTPEGAFKAKESEANASYLESLLLSMFLSPVVQNKQMGFSEIQQSSLAPGVWKRLGVNVSWYEVRQPTIWFAGMDPCNLQTHSSILFYIFFWQIGVLVLVCLKMRHLTDLRICNV